jgi:hypothetical protein
MACWRAMTQFQDGRRSRNARWRHAAEQYLAPARPENASPPPPLRSQQVGYLPKRSTTPGGFLALSW